MNIINVTAHDINIYRESDVVFDYRTRHYILQNDLVTPLTIIIPSGIVARCHVESQIISYLDGIPIYRTVFGTVYDMPGPTHATIFITSLHVAQALARMGRSDCRVPYNMVYDRGRVIGCLGLSLV